MTFYLLDMTFYQVDMTFYLLDKNMIRMHPGTAPDTLRIHGLFSKISGSRMNTGDI
jgi:hypothetical protein